MQWSPLFPELYIINKWWHRNKLSRVIFFVQFKIYVCLHMIWFIVMIFSWKLQKQNKKEKIKLKTSKPSIHVPFTVRLCTNKNLSRLWQWQNASFQWSEGPSFCSHKQRHVEPLWASHLPSEVKFLEATVTPHVC